MTKFLRAVVSNLATLMLSFCLAFIIWIAALQDNDPTTTKSLQLDLETRGLLPAEGEVDIDTDVVRVTLEGPQSVINPLTSADLEAFIDLSEVAFGTSQVDVNLEYPQDTVEIVFQEPRTTDVTVEQIISREIPVRVLVRGTTARGHTAEEPVSDPEFILVTGAANRINQLLEAQVTVFLDEPREDVVQIRRPIYYDKESRPVGISTLTTSTEEVQVTVPIREIAGVADKPIIVNWTGTPAIGYRLLNVTVEPTSVLVTGSPTQLEDIRSISTEPIDISGLNESFTTRVALDLPESIALDEVQPAIVTFEIEPIFTTSVVRKPPEVRGLSPGFTATVSPQELSIFLFGPLPILESITDTDLNVTLDLLELEEGVHTVEPLVNINVNDVEVRSYQPEQVTVSIVVDEDFVPTPTVTPTATSAPATSPTAVRPTPTAVPTAYP